MSDNEKTPLNPKGVRRYKSIQTATKNRSKIYGIKNRSNTSARIVYRKPKTLGSVDDSSSVKSLPISESKLKELSYEGWKKSANKIFDNWAEMGQKPTLRQRMAFYLDTSTLGRYWDLFDFIFSLAFASIYIWNTQYGRQDNVKQNIPALYHFLELFFGSILLIQWLPRLYISPDMKEEIVKPFSMLTLISTIPPITILISDYWIRSIDFSSTYMLSGNFVYLYPFRFARLSYSLHKLLIPVKNSIINLSLVAKKTISLCSTILGTILFTSSLIHITSVKFYDPLKDPPIPNFFDTFYFTALSATSGLSSKLVPDKPFTRIVVLYIMIAGALFLPGKISELLTLINKRSPYSRPFEAESNEQHILVVGDFDYDSLFEFLREFFCEDHGLQTMNSSIVILNENEPSEALVNILNDPAYSNRVQYVKGSPISFRSLKKAQASKAKACFVLTNKFSRVDDRKADATSVMMTLAIKRYNKNIKLYAQVSLPENKPHFNQLTRQVICIQELRFGMTAQNILNPGFSTLIYLLSTSLTESTCAELSLSLKLKPDLAWLDEYIQGASHEIYSINFAKCFVGMKFIDVAEVIYRYFGITLFAIHIPCNKSSQKSNMNYKRNIFLNPYSYKIVGGETGFIISSSAYDANRISRLGEKDHPFDEQSALYTEDLQYYFKDRANAKNPILTESSQGSSNADEKKPSQSPIPLEKTETNRSLGEKTEKIKKKLVLDSDAGTSDEDTDKKDDANPSDQSKPLNPVLDEELAAEPNLSVQERNIAQVVSEMMKDNTYFNDLGEINKLNGHVVVCDLSDTFPKSMEYLVGTLRGPHLIQQFPIVILSSAAPSDAQRYVLQQHGDVYFVQGSALSRKDLFTAGVTRAKKAVILCNDRSSTLDPRTTDSSSLLVVLNMESMALDPDFFVMVEFVHRENMKLIGAGETIPVSEAYAQALLRPSFMSGHVNSPCMLEPLICQSYYDDFILDVIDRLIFDPYLDSWRKTIDDSSPTPSVNGKPENIPTTHLFTSALPPAFIGRPYFHLVSWLMKEKNTVPMGLYRTRVYRGRQISYAIPNPSPQLLLAEQDKFYILAEYSLSFDL